jgi:hypothetical protein
VNARAYYTDLPPQYSVKAKLSKLAMICLTSSIFDNIIKNKKQSGINSNLIPPLLSFFSCGELLMNKEKQEGSSSPNRDKIIKVQQLGGDDNFSELSRSEYSMKDVIDLAEFRSLSKEIHLHDEQQNRLVDSFYCPQWRPESSRF